MPYEVIVDIEPRNKEFRVEVMSDTTIEEVITTLISRCEDEGINIADWGKEKVGSANVSFTMLRKSTGNTALAPAVTFGELFPVIEDRETFRLDARAQVGASPETLKKISDDRAQVGTSYSITIKTDNPKLDTGAVERIIIAAFRKYGGLADYSVSIVQKQQEQAQE